MENAGKIYERYTDNEHFRELLIGIWSFPCICGDSHRLTFSKDGTMQLVITFPRSKGARFNISLHNTNELQGYWEVKDTKFTNVIKLVHMNVEPITAIEKKKSLERRLESRNPFTQKSAVLQSMMNSIIDTFMDNGDDPFGIKKVINSNEIYIYKGRDHQGSMKRL